MSNPFLGEIRMFGFNFPPRGWARCQGQLMAISQNDALFALIGTTYGGDGVQTFSLPDLQGRVPLHRGQGPGLSNYILGQVSGVETVTLITTQLPAHNHVAVAISVADSTDPSTDAIWATPPDAMYGGLPPVNTNGAVSGPMSPFAMGITGGSQPHDNMPPFTAINYCIALEGVFPTRN